MLVTDSILDVKNNVSSQMNLRACQQLYLLNKKKIREMLFFNQLLENDVFLLNEHLTYGILEQAGEKKIEENSAAFVSLLA